MAVNTTVWKVFHLVSLALAANPLLASMSVRTEKQFDTPQNVETDLQSSGAVVLVGLPQFDRVPTNRVKVSVQILIMVNPELFADAPADEVAENVWAALENYTHTSHLEFSPLIPQRLDQQYADDGILICVVDVETTTGIRVTAY